MNPKAPPIKQVAAALNAERQRSGLSLTEVARRANIAKSTLSQLENGMGNPSLETLWSICIVLDIPISRLLESPKPETRVIRCGEGVSLASERMDSRATLLAACPPGVNRDIYWIEVQQGQAHYSDPHHMGVIEHVIITQGRARLGLVSESYELGPGDYICYPGDLPHMFEAFQGTACAMLISEYR